MHDDKDDEKCIDEKMYLDIQILNLSNTTRFSPKLGHNFLLCKQSNVSIISLFLMMNIGSYPGIYYPDYDFVIPPIHSISTIVPRDPFPVIFCLALARHLLRLGGREH